MAVDIVHKRDAFLLPRHNVRAALKLFLKAEMETPPVLDGTKTRRITGYLTEAYTLRRYTQELERKRRGDLGEARLPG